MMHMIQYDSLCLAVQLVFTIERDILPGPFINFYGSGVHTRGIPHYTVLYFTGAMDELHEIMRTS